jgi:TolB protein
LGRNTAPRKIAYGRVYPQQGQLALFVSASDGSGERPLLASPDTDYDPVWAPDGGSIVFTSDRNGQADLFRVNPDGSGLTRLTTDAAYDDQASFSPDSRQLVFVSTRGGGTAKLWTMDLATLRAKALTTGKDGDFRPSWSPDGKWIAFSSVRGNPMPFRARQVGAASVGGHLHHSPGRLRTEEGHQEWEFLWQPKVDGR